MTDAPRADEARADEHRTDVASLSYEEARDELVQVVARLEQGAATLEESLGLWERGEALAGRCAEWLVGAKARLDAARAAAEESGAPATPESRRLDGPSSRNSAVPRPRRRRRSARPPRAPNGAAIRPPST